MINYEVESTKSEILERLQGGKMKVNELMKELTHSKDDEFAFRTAVIRLNEEEKVTGGVRSDVIALNTNRKSKVCVITSQSKSFAFARPDDGTPDIFLHFSKMGDAMIKDTVLVDNIQEDDRGVSGRVKKILEEGVRETTGRMEENNGFLDFVADIPVRYSLPVLRSSLKNVKSGDKVMARLERSNKTGKLMARILKVYGNASSAKICANAILEQFNITTPFPKEVIREAEEAAKQGITKEERAKRTDMTDLPILTIDSESAKDLDDAVCVRKTDRGYELSVHIADVSHFVKMGTALDQEAIRRGTSVYMPDRVVPMLPTALSNDACSLNAGTEKLTFSAVMELDGKGDFISYRFCKAIIVSKVRGVYSEVNEIFAGTASQEILDKYAPVMESLMLARELADILKKKSKANGTMEIESRESSFILDENGVCIDVIPHQTGEAEELIEQLMVTANQAAAKLAQDNDLPFVYRIHEKPDPERIEILQNLLTSLKLPFAELRRDNPTTAQFAAVMDSVKGTPLSKIVSLQVLRTMEKARYSTDPIGHFGLALSDYSHFTSPIRRYPDTCIHRILSDFVENENIKLSKQKFTAYTQKVARDCSQLEVAAMQAERTADDVFTAEYLKQHIGEEFDGIICGVTMRGVFVELENSAEGFVAVDSFTDAEFEFDGNLTQIDHASQTSMTIGQALRVKIVAAEVATGRVDMMPATGTLASLGSAIH